MGTVLMMRSELEKAGPSAASTPKNDGDLNPSATTQSSKEEARLYPTCRRPPMTRIIRLRGSRFSSLPKRFSTVGYVEEMQTGNQLPAYREAERGTSRRVPHKHEHNSTAP